MKVSILTPVFKVEDFIEQCATCLFEQTYDDIEYIFVDDCSPDSSIRILENTIKKYPNRVDQIKILHHNKNRGVSAARNTALENATGDYLYSVDADDRIAPDTIELLVKASQEGKKDIVRCGWYLSFGKNERNMGNSRYDSPEDALKAMLAGKLRWNLWLYLIRREILINWDIKCTEGENIGEDMLLMIKVMSRARTISFVDKSLYHYASTNSNAQTKENAISQTIKVLVNVNKAIAYLQYHFPNKYDKEICLYKLVIKLPLLITDRHDQIEEWRHIFPEANSYSFCSNYQSLKTRILQYSAVKKWDLLIIFYYKTIIKLIYGYIYK